ncbi:unnamed protein product [Didymodactylos carnosus]|uniref:F-box domain-containing protein n=1 Tax=Didymodactylos carnosus TaxID=1234261 RepID=A0A815Y8X4_9BILA|nr:unnamed protein product [Didymodactylos carnosus]CAF4429988.1 unnamed protein product [Didymodactylos carnosus]
MSEVQTVMKLEFLPNEILMECFKYLNALDIFRSFDQLNYRFSKLIRNISLYLNCQYTCKSTFDQFCMKMLSNPDIKIQIRSLHLSNKGKCAVIQTFLSYFSLYEFFHLRSVTLTGVRQNNVEKLESMLPLMPELLHFHFIDSETTIDKLVSALLMSKLRTLSVSTLNASLIPMHQISITKLTISLCSLHKLVEILKCLPMLIYLDVKCVPNERCGWLNNKINFIDHYNINLKQLVMTELDYTFDDLVMFLKRTPNLKSLTISADDNIDMINGYRWEYLITSSLPYLDIFKFKFACSHGNKNNNILDKFEKFQSDFWQEQHHWYTECKLETDSALIYTIPYISNVYVLTPYTTRYYNRSINNTNIFDNVSNLILYQEAITLKGSYHFSNATSLTLENKLCFDDVDDQFLKTEHIHFLKMIVKLSNLKHLTISSTCEIESLLVLLQLLRQTSQLSSITIQPYRLRSFFNDDELRKYLNKMIKILDIYMYPYDSFNSSGEIEQFCKILSNIEQLTCYINQKDHLVFLLKHLSKLSVMRIFLPTLDNRDCFTRWLKDEARKLKLTLHIDFENKFEKTLCIWIDKTIR